MTKHVHHQGLSWGSSFHESTAEHVISILRHRLPVKFLCFISKRALIRCIGYILCRGWAQQIYGRWRDALSPDSPPLVSDYLDLLPCDIALDFPFRESLMRT